LDAAAARPIVLQPGTVQPDVNFKIVRRPTFHVHGKVVGASGQPEPAVSVGLNPNASISVSASLGSGSFRGATIDDGAFDFPGVPSGTYTLSGSTIGGVGISRSDQSGS